MLNLHGIASRLRAQRFERGCLKLDNVKLSFQMDDEGNPLAASPHGEPRRIEDLTMCVQAAADWLPAPLVGAGGVKTDSCTQQHRGCLALPAGAADTKLPELLAHAGPYQPCVCSIRPRSRGHALHLVLPMRQLMACDADPAAPGTYMFCPFISAVVPTNW